MDRYLKPFHIIDVELEEKKELRGRFPGHTHEDPLLNTSSSYFVIAYSFMDFVERRSWNVFFPIQSNIFCCLWYRNRLHLFLLP